MHQQNALELFSFELELPGEDASGDHWHRRNRRTQQIVIGYGSESPPFAALRQEVEDYADDKQGDGKVNQYDVLRMLRKQCGLDVKRVQVPSSACRRSLDDNFSGHLGMDRAKVGIFARLREGVKKFLVGVSPFDLNTFS